MLRRYFLDHPASVGETYLEHMAQASFFARHMAIGAAACAVHAFFPFLFTRNASARIAMLHERMIHNRVRIAQVAADPIDLPAAAE